MTTYKRIAPIVAAVMLVGLVSAASADRNWDRGPARGNDPYRHDLRFDDGYTYMDHWGGNVKEVGRGWFTIIYRRELLQVRITEGQPRLRPGERVRVVPFRQDGRHAVAEIRLADRGFQPVATAKYLSARIAARPNQRGWYIPAHGQENRRDAGYQIDRRGDAFRTPHFRNEGYKDRKTPVIEFNGNRNRKQGRGQGGRR